MSTVRQLTTALAWLAFVAWIGLCVLHVEERSWCLAGAIWAAGIAFVIPTRKAVPQPTGDKM